MGSRILQGSMFTVESPELMNIPRPEGFYSQKVWEVRHRCFASGGSDQLQWNHSLLTLAGGFEDLGSHGRRDAQPAARVHCSDSINDSVCQQAATSSDKQLTWRGLFFGTHIFSQKSRWIWERSSISQMMITCQEPMHVGL